jgi:hypothetical protein
MLLGYQLSHEALLQYTFVNSNPVTPRHVLSLSAHANARWLLN